METENAVWRQFLFIDDTQNEKQNTPAACFFTRWFLKQTQKDSNVRGEAMLSLVNVYHHSLLLFLLFTSLQASCVASCPKKTFSQFKDRFKEVLCSLILLILTKSIWTCSCDFEDGTEVASWVKRSSRSPEQVQLLQLTLFHLKRCVVLSVEVLIHPGYLKLEQVPEELKKPLG